MSDLINRQDAIDAINSLPDCPNGYSDTYDKARIIGVIEDLLSADMREIVKGEWIDDVIYAEGHSERSYRCSVCEKQFIGWVDEYNFCPHCGANMKGKE